MDLFPDLPGGVKLRSYFAKIMTLPEKPDFQHPQFFISQIEKLSALLNVVVAEASVAVEPEAVVDYLELTEILTELLNEAQSYSVLASGETQIRERQVRSFLDKIQTVQEAVADWDARTNASAKAVSRKRTRSVDLGEETMGALKRRRNSGSEQGMCADAAVNGPFANVLPSIENPPIQWWTEPFCD